MANTQDAQNLEKIEEGIDDLLTQSKDELTDELEKEAALQLQRGMRDSRKEISEDMAEGMGNEIYQNKPQKKAPLTPDEKRQNVRDRSIRQTAPADDENTPDTIYGNREDQRSQDMPGDYEEALKENVDRDQESALQENIDRDHEEALKENKSREKGKDEKTTTGAPKTGETPQTTEEAAARDKTPDWQKQEPTTAEGGMARADTGDISPKKKEGEKPESEETKQKQQEQDGKEMDRQKMREKRAQQKKEKKEKAAEEAVSTKETAEKEVGKMSPMAFMFWIFLAIMCDVGSLIPYVGLIFSWPFAAAFAAYKWIKKIKKEVAIATTALDFILEGILSTLPVNTIDVILTFVVSNSKTVRKIAKKIPSATPKK